MIKKTEKSFLDVQSSIIETFTSFEDKDCAKIHFDSWKRDEGGGGKTYVIEDGKFFDNCAVNFSSIEGKELPKTALANNLNKEVKFGYRAMGVSVIAHPNNPHVPTSHMNVRLFGILDKNKDICDWWIGGGYDLTPYIPYKEDAISWHADAKDCLNVINKDYYSTFSENCNNYFNIPHRNERRGIGGIFFDNITDLSLEDSVKMLKSVANSYIKSYKNIVDKRKNYDFDEFQKEFQLIRRGRYIEFNLVYDRGTLFGLQSKGRIESILASLPKNAKWMYKKIDIYEKMEQSLLEFINKDWNV
jgi:coproporphyrinogen III oxidase